MTAAKPQRCTCGAGRPMNLLEAAAEGTAVEQRLPPDARRRVEVFTRRCEAGMWHVATRRKPGRHRG